MKSDDEPRPLFSAPNEIVTENPMHTGMSLLSYRYHVCMHVFVEACASLSWLSWLMPIHVYDGVHEYDPVCIHVCGHVSTRATIYHE